MLQQSEYPLLRTSRSEDVPGVEKLFVRSFRERPGPYAPEQVEAAIRAGIGRAPDLFAAGRGVVAEIGARLVGAAAWSTGPHPFPPGGASPQAAPGEATLRAVCVLASAGGRGIGARLLEAVLADARAAGAVSATLLSTAGAADFYARNGFVAVERFDLAIDGQVSLPVAFMRRALT